MKNYLVCLKPKDFFFGIHFIIIFFKDDIFLFPFYFFVVILLSKIIQYTMLKKVIAMSSLNVKFYILFLFSGFFLRVCTMYAVVCNEAMLAGLFFLIHKCFNIS